VVCCRQCAGDWIAAEPRGARRSDAWSDAWPALGCCRGLEGGVGGWEVEEGEIRIVIRVRLGEDYIYKGKR